MSHLFIIEDIQPNNGQQGERIYPLLFNIYSFEFNYDNSLTLYGTLSFVQVNHNDILMQIIYLLELVLDIYNLLDTLDEIHSILDTISDIPVQLRIRQELLLEILGGLPAELLIVLVLPGQIEIEVNISVKVFLRLDIHWPIVEE